MFKKILLSTAIMVGFAIGAKAQTADEIVAAHVKALGGEKKLKDLKTVVMEGGMNVMGNDVAVQIFQESGKGMRQNISISGMEGYTIVTPKEGWAFMPFMGQTEAEAVPEADLQQAVDDLDLSGLFNFAEKGHTVTYDGKEDVSGTECYKLTFNRKTSGPVTLFIDPASNLIVRSVSKRNVMGQDMDMVTDFSDFREVDGYKFPFSITQQFGTVNFSSIKVNEKLPEDIFTRK